MLFAATVNMIESKERESPLTAACTGEIVPTVMPKNLHTQTLAIGE